MPSGRITSPFGTANIVLFSETNTFLPYFFLFLRK
uniref:Uncharacterized protein n=1 Tax=Siphoviridae sp. ctBLh2 TaxID=2827803 RepID=A0A8S5S3H1_9CAUD|nr:MAG TPA: hypothetical protein [Siphoviridae sp. ctBLh2]